MEQIKVTQNMRGDDREKVDTSLHQRQYKTYLQTHQLEKVQVMSRKINQDYQSLGVLKKDATLSSGEKQMVVEEQEVSKHRRQCIPQCWKRLSAASQSRKQQSKNDQSEENIFNFGENSTSTGLDFSSRAEMMVSSDGEEMIESFQTSTSLQDLRSNDASLGVDGMQNMSSPVETRTVAALSREDEQPSSFGSGLLIRLAKVLEEHPPRSRQPPTRYGSPKPVGRTISTFNPRSDSTRSESSTGLFGSFSRILRSKTRSRSETHLVRPMTPRSRASGFTRLFKTKSKKSELILEKPSYSEKGNKTLSSLTVPSSPIRPKLKLSKENPAASQARDDPLIADMNLSIFEKSEARTPPALPPRKPRPTKKNSQDDKVDEIEAMICPSAEYLSNHYRGGEGHISL